MPRIVLDTDMGSDVDDALCLALALAAPEIELIAVTHVSGDTRRRAQISRRLLDLAGRGAVPVYAGRSQPLDGSGRFVWFGHEGVGILDDESATPVPDDDAVEVLCCAFRAPTDLELVTVGPLTNVAAALETDPSVVRGIRQLTVMGGYLRGAIYEPRIEDGVHRTRERPGSVPGAHRVRCATAVDSARFVNHFRNRLGIGT